MSSMHDGDPAFEGEVSYDSEHKRAMHIVSGMAVEFAGTNPYPLERECYFKFIWKGEETGFSAGWYTPYADIMEKYPDLDSGEIDRMSREKNEKYFDISINPDLIRVMKRSDDKEYIGIIPILVKRVLDENLFRVPDRGSVNPTALAGMGRSLCLL